MSIQSVAAVAGGVALVAGTGILSAQSAAGAVEHRIGLGEDPGDARYGEVARRGALGYAGTALLLSAGMAARGGAAAIFEKVFMPIALAGIGFSLGSMVGSLTAGRS